MILRLHIIILALIAGNSFGTIVTLKGVAPGYKGHTAHLYLYEDYCTYDYTLNSSAELDSTERFSFALDIKQVKMAFVRISGVNGKLFLEPGAMYDIEFPLPPGGTINTVHSRNKVEVLFNSLPEDDLNYLLIDFNQHYENFFSENYRKLAAFKRSGRTGYKVSIDNLDSIPTDSIRSRDDAPQSMDELILNFQEEIEQKYAGVESEYFKTYRDYSFAGMRTSATMSKKRAYQEFIKNSPIQLKHHEYMSYINDFLEGRFYKRVMEELNDSLGLMVHNGKDFAKVVQLMQRDEFLEHKELAEYAVLYGLFRGFYNQSYARNAVIALVDQAREKAKHETTREIASNMYGLLTRLRQGFDAWNFELKNRDDELVSLESFNGKYVYVGFYADWCNTCLAEMKKIPEFDKKYGKDIEFISISLDNDFETMSNFVRKNRDYRWTFLHHENNPELKDQYDIQAIPAFVFIDPEGKILSARELKPSEVVEKKFFKIHKELHPKSRLKVGGEPPKSSTTNRGRRRR